ncbi:MAG: hypothetical protein WA728_16910, partial [Xanthobacteraceae bacterium]
MTTAKASHPIPAKCPPSPLVLFGIDSRGKPKAARFGRKHASLAIKAATQLQLNVLASNDPGVAEIAARLPVGRVHATGRMFVPFIRRDLYDRLVAAAPNGNFHQPPSPPASGVSGGAAGSPPGSAPNLPRNWQEIGVDDLVLAQEDPKDGWYEVIVVEIANDMLTLRWRDYPRQRKVVRHRLRVGLLYPGPRSSAEIGKSGKHSGHGKHDKTVEANSVTGNHGLPKDWNEIDVDHLVLAKTEGPWANWFEAIPIERADDGLKLRWRDYR